MVDKLKSPNWKFTQKSMLRNKKVIKLQNLKQGKHAIEKQILTESEDDQVNVIDSLYEL